MTYLKYKEIDFLVGFENNNYLDKQETCIIPQGYMKVQTSQWAYMQHWFF